MMAGGYHRKFFLNETGFKREMPTLASWKVCLLVEGKLCFVMQTPHTLKETGLGFYASQENHVHWVKIIP
jgi:hypothetical protein